MATESTLDAMVKNHPSFENDFSNNVACREDILSSNVWENLSLLSFVEGFRNKPSFGLRAWNHLILTLDGRDKVTKLLQYVCRLLAWWLQQPKIAISNKRYVTSRLLTFLNAERFAAMKNSLATSRKAFRLGRSMVEIQKIQSLGIFQLLDSYLKRLLLSSDPSDDSKVTTNTLLRPLRTVIHSIVHPLLLSVNVPLTPSADRVNILYWNVAGNSIKSLGLLIFWAADNMSFLLQSGFLDDYQTEANDRLYKRSRQIAKATNIANQSYFIAAIAGLATNWISYWKYTSKEMLELKNNVSRSETNDEKYDEAKKTLQKAQEKQFTLFVALVKSICDVLVFSNNAGVDLWKRYCGRPLHEGLHCLCGIVSATVVLYNNYPNLSDLE